MLTLNNPIKTTLVTAIFLSMTACASLNQTSESIDNAEDDVKLANAQLATMRNSGAVVRYDHAKIGGTEIAVTKSDRLPEIFSRPFSFLTVNKRFPALLSEIGRRTGLKLVVQPGLDASSDTAQTNASANNLSLEWQGDLRGLMDYIAATKDASWKFEDGKVVFFKTETRIFNVYLPAGKRAVSASISLSGAGGTGGGAGGGGATGGGDGTVSVSSNTEIDAYEAIAKSVELIVADGAAAAGAGTAATTSVVPNPTLGTITVTATPALLARVESYIDATNLRFAQNVLINVKVFNLTFNRGVSAGAQADLIYNNIASKYNVRLTTPTNIQPSSGTPGSIVVSDIGTRFAGSGAIIEALEQVGKVSFVTSGQVVAANGQPSPLQVANDITYVSGSTTTQTANVGATTTRETDTLTVGFTANFLPLILGDNRIMLQYQLNLSSLLALDQIGEADSLIQIPSIAKQTLQQQAFVRDGEAIVLFGYEQERNAKNAQRFFPGISRSADTDRTMMVIVMEVYGGK